MYQVHKNLNGDGYTVYQMRYSGFGYYEPFGAPVIVQTLDSYRIGDVGLQMLDCCAVLVKVPAA